MNKGMTILFVILLIVLVLGTYSLVTLRFKEGYDNYTLNNEGGFPSSIDDSGLLMDEYPSTGRKVVTNNEYSNIWWYYPIFKVGSYAQITNNIRYSRNPDEGTCAPAEFCGALYKDHQLSSNIITPLPPVPDAPGIRVNYYRTQENLFLGPQPGPKLELPAF